MIVEKFMRPRAVTVEPGENFTLKVGFNNGETRMFDVKPYLHGEWFSQLKDVSVFNTVHVAGLSIKWTADRIFAQTDCITIAFL